MKNSQATSPAEGDERLDPGVASTIRQELMRRVAADRPAPSEYHPQRRSRLVPAITLVVVAAVVASVSTALLLRPTPPPAAGPTGSALAFDGRCERILSQADADRIAGSPLAPPVDATRSAALEASTAALVPVGGVHCLWSEEGGAGVDVLALPAALAPAKSKDPYCYGTDSAAVCTFDARSSGVWMTGRVRSTEGSEARVRARVSELTALLDAAAATAGGRPALPERAAGTWRRGTDCAALVRDADLATVLRSPGLVGAPGNDGGTEAADGQSAATAYLGVTACIAEGGRGSVDELTVAVLPGGAALRSLVEADPTVRTRQLPEQRSALVITPDDGYAVLFVFDGPNALRIDTDARSVPAVAAAVGPLLTQLNERRLP